MLMVALGRRWAEVQFGDASALGEAGARWCFWEKVWC